MVERFGAPGRNRTCDNQLRRLVLYPTELRARPRHLFRQLTFLGAFLTHYEQLLQT